MKTKQIHFIFFSFLLMIGLSSCMDEIFLEGNGHLETQNRSITGFDEVHSSGDFNVKVVPGSEFSVVVKAESNLLPYIETNVSGKTLKIGTNGIHSLHHNLPIEVLITQPELKGLSLSGSGLLYTGSFDCDNIQISLSGSGDIDTEISADKVKANISGSGTIFLAGEAFESDFRISGSGKIKAYDLVQDHCQTSISGSGDMYVNVSETLYAGISGSGKIFYINHPAVQSNISGSGKVIDKN